MVSGQSLGSLNHTYADNGNYTVTVTVTDKDGGAGSASFTATVANVAPTAIFSNDGPVDEGSSFHLSLTNPSDPSTADTTAGFTYAFDCGDGSGYGAFSASASATCPTNDNGIRSVKGKIMDKDGGVTEYTDSVTVNNVAPTAIFNATTPVDEGSASTLSFSNPVDPSSADTSAGFHYAYNCDGGSLAGATYANSGTNVSTTCTYPDGPSDHSVRAKIIDKDDSYSEYLTTVHVNNVAPSTPNLLAPADNSNTNDATPAFDWSDSTDPAGTNDTITYAIQANLGSCDFTGTNEIDVSGLSSFELHAELGSGGRHVLLARRRERRGRRHQRLELDPERHHRHAEPDLAGQLAAVLDRHQLHGQLHGERSGQERLAHRAEEGRDLREDADVGRLQPHPNVRSRERERQLQLHGDRRRRELLLLLDRLRQRRATSKRLRCFRMTVTRVTTTAVDTVKPTSTASVPGLREHDDLHGQLHSDRPGNQPVRPRPRRPVLAGPARSDAGALRDATRDAGIDFSFNYTATEGDGTYTFYTVATDKAGNVEATPAADADSTVLDTVAPTVTINQAAGQADPTNASPINFTVVFSEPVSDFATGDVTLSGTRGSDHGDRHRQRHDLQRGGHRHDRATAR